MKNKFVFLVFVFIISFAFIRPAYSSEPCAETSTLNVDAYRYVSLGVGPFIFMPNVGVGYRERHCQFGWDTALSFSTVGYAHQLSGHTVGHYYLRPLRKNSAYLGLGLMGSTFFTNHKGGGNTLSTDFIFGKELERSGDNKNFIEMHVAIPSVLINSRHSHVVYFPLMYIKYGTAF